VLFTLPQRKIFCTLAVSVPIDLNQSAPLFMMSGTFAHVSTLFNALGLSHAFSDVYVFSVWVPQLFLNRHSSQLDSPETNAPAPL
jgi:hypothetical protein